MESAGQSMKVRRPPPPSRPAHPAGLRNCTVGRLARRDHKKQQSPEHKCAIAQNKEGMPKLFAAPLLKLSTATKIHDLLSKSAAFMFFYSAYRKHSLSNKAYRAIFSHLFSFSTTPLCLKFSYESDGDFRVGSTESCIACSE